MAEAAKLKASVYRATCDSGGGEGDAAAMIEINETLLEHPHLYRPLPAPPFCKLGRTLGRGRSVSRWARSAARQYQPLCCCVPEHFELHPIRGACATIESSLRRGAADSSALAESAHGRS